LKRNVRRPLGGIEIQGECFLVYEVVPRLVALSLEAALEEHCDYFDPKRGWFRDGLKPEREHADNLGSGAPFGSSIAGELSIVEVRERGWPWPPRNDSGDLAWMIWESREALDRLAAQQTHIAKLEQALAEHSEPADSQPDAPQPVQAARTRTTRRRSNAGSIERTRLTRAQRALASGPGGRQPLQDDADQSWRAIADEVIKLRASQPRPTWDQLPARLGKSRATLQRWAKWRKEERATNR
jgi:hypothetical protein